MHNRPNIKSMQTIGFSGKIVSALWRFKGRCLKIRWIRGPEVHCGGEGGATPRHVPWHLPMSALGASQAHTVH